MSSRAPSQSLARAAGAEFDRIERMLGVLARRRSALQAQLGDLDAEVAELHHRQRLLQMLVPAQFGADASIVLDTSAVMSPSMLKGRTLRRVAGRLLWESHVGNEIHYREWFERVMAAGYAVGGKEPSAAFLTNIRDSPAVVRGSHAGYYRLDPASRERLQQELSEATAELADVSRLLEDARHPGASIERADRLRAHRDALLQRIRKLELDREELDAIFSVDIKLADVATDARGDSLRAA